MPAATARVPAFFASAFETVWPTLDRLMNQIVWLDRGGMLIAEKNARRRINLRAPGLWTI
jgi:hypothetical protein